MTQSIKVLESKDGSMQERTMSKTGKIGSRREIMRKKKKQIVKEKENKIKQNGQQERERSGTWWRSKTRGNETEKSKKNNIAGAEIPC